jgi:hypothetical protein
MSNDSDIKNVSNTGKWKESSDGGRHRTGTDGRDGSYKVEKISSGADHEHRISKTSTDGKVKEIYRGPKSKRI